MKDRDYLNAFALADLALLLRYLEDRLEEADKELWEHVHRFDRWKQRIQQPESPTTLEELPEYLTQNGLFHGMFASQAGTCDHYGGAVDILRCMKGEIEELMKRKSAEMDDETADLLGDIELLLDASD